MGETPGYEVVTYDTFGPKLIAMREDFKDDAVGSRCITIHLLPCDANELEGIKLYIDGEFREQAQAIRNLLLRWRLETWESEIRTGRDIEIMKGVSPRLAQVLLPIMAIAENDVVLRTQIDQYASEVRMRRALESRKPQDA